MALRRMHVLRAAAGIATALLLTIISFFSSEDSIVNLKGNTNVSENLTFHSATERASTKLMESDGSLAYPVANASDNDTLSVTCDTAVNLTERKITSMSRTRVKFLEFGDHPSMKGVRRKSTLPHVTLHHPMKTGGGTVKYRLRTLWRIGFDISHPVPCKSAMIGDVNFMTFRDPVDRLISTFNWRSLVLCNPLGDDRNRSNSQKTARNPLQYCKPKYPTEASLLYITYNRNVGEFVDALCDSRDTVRRKEAQDHLEQIAFLKYGYKDWLDAMRWHMRQESLFPIVLEEGFDLEGQIDDAMKYMKKLTGFPRVLDFKKRKHWIQEVECLTKTSKEKYRHSSKMTLLGHNDYIDDEYEQHEDQQNKSDESKETKSDLSLSQEACIVNFFAEDYKALHRVKKKGCRTSVCKDAIQSILDRRSKFLDDDIFD